MLGGSGEKKTFRLAARYADHLNLITPMSELRHKLVRSSPCFVDGLGC
jgi:hypothetical protein